MKFPSPLKTLEQVHLISCGHQGEEIILRSAMALHAEMPRPSGRIGTIICAKRRDETR